MQQNENDITFLNNYSLVLITINSCQTLVNN